MYVIRSYESVMVPAIDRTVAGTAALCTFLRTNCPLKNIADIRDRANNAAIAAHEAKVVFDREFRGKEVPDPSKPEKKIIQIEEVSQIKVVQLLSRHLNQAHTLMRALRDAVYEREYIEEPGLRPKGFATEADLDDLTESLRRPRQEIRKIRIENEALYEAQSEMPEHQIIRTIDKGAFLGILADAVGELRSINETINASAKDGKKTIR